MKLLLLLGFLSIPAQADFRDHFPDAPPMKKWPPSHGSEQEPHCRYHPWDQQAPDPENCDGTWMQSWDKRGCKQWFCAQVEKPFAPEPYCGPGGPPEPEFGYPDGCKWILFADSCYHWVCR